MRLPHKEALYQVSSTFTFYRLMYHLQLRQLYCDGLRTALLHIGPGYNPGPGEVFFFCGQVPPSVFLFYLVIWKAAMCERWTCLRAPLQHGRLAAELAGTAKRNEDDDGQRTDGNPVLLSAVRSDVL